MATIQKVGLYVMITLVGMVVAALAAYYILVQFVYPLKSSDIIPAESFRGISQARGVIVTIDRDIMSVSTTTLITITTSTSEQKVVKAPVHPGIDCVTVNVVDPAGLVVGDIIDVKGASEDNGDIFPCKEKEHHLVKVVAAIPVVTEEIIIATSTASTTLESTDVPME